MSMRVSSALALKCWTMRELNSGRKRPCFTRPDELRLLRLVAPFQTRRGRHRDFGAGFVAQNWRMYGPFGE